MSENLALKIARHRVHSYANDSDELMQNHLEAMECRDCEEFLAKGIDAFKWLRNADETMREADYQGVFEFTNEMQQAMDDLYTAWLVPCRFAETWITSLAGRGYTPANVSKFRKACEEAESIIQRRQWQNRATGTRVITSADEDW